MDKTQIKYSGEWRAYVLDIFRPLVGENWKLLHDAVIG